MATICPESSAHYPAQVLQARLFAYPDAARYRLGVNYQQLPTNAAKAPVYCPFQRDGKMRFDDNYGGDPNYVGSSLHPIQYYQDVKETKAAALSLHADHSKWVGQVAAFTSEIADVDFIQPAALWQVIGRDDGHQERVIENLASSIKQVKYPDLREAVYSEFETASEQCDMSRHLQCAGLFSRVSHDLGYKLRQKTEAAIGQN